MSYITETLEIRNKSCGRRQALRRLRDEIRPELISITDPKAVISISRNELFEQVSYILSEILHKYTFKLTGEEIREMAQALSNELAASCRATLNPRPVN